MQSSKVQILLSWAGIELNLPIIYDNTWFIGDRGEGFGGRLVGGEVFLMKADDLITALEAGLKMNFLFVARSSGGGNQSQTG